MRSYDGKCERLHGHNWQVEVTASGDTLDKLGVIIDFHILKEKLDRVLAPFDHTRMNSVPPFDQINPSAENLANFVCEKLMKEPEISKVCRIKKVVVVEDEGFTASFTP